MQLCADADRCVGRPASGVLACPSCATGRLRVWGYQREPVIRTFGYASRHIRLDILPESHPDAVAAESGCRKSIDFWAVTVCGGTASSTVIGGRQGSHDGSQRWC
jgi:hypothetical protein